MSINWQNVALMDHKMKEIPLPRSAWVSVFTERELDEIHHNRQYSVKLFGRILDQIMEIPIIDDAAIAQPVGQPAEPPAYTS